MNSWLGRAFVAVLAFATLGIGHPESGQAQSGTLVTISPSDGVSYGTPIINQAGDVAFGTHYMTPGGLYLYRAATGTTSHIFATTDWVTPNSMNESGDILFGDFDPNYGWNLAVYDSVTGAVTTLALATDWIYFPAQFVDNNRQVTWVGLDRTTFAYRMMRYDLASGTLVQLTDKASSNLFGSANGTMAWVEYDSTNTTATLKVGNSPATATAVLSQPLGPGVGLYMYSFSDNGIALLQFSSQDPVTLAYIYRMVSFDTNTGTPYELGTVVQGVQSPENVVGARNGNASWAVYNSQIRNYEATYFYDSQSHTQTTVPFPANWSSGYVWTLNSLGQLVEYGNGSGVTGAALTRWSPADGLVPVVTGGSYPNLGGINDKGEIAILSFPLGNGPVSVQLWTPSSPNSPPIATVAPVPAFNVGDEIVLDGTGSSDPDGDLLTFNWIVTDADGNPVTLADGTTPRPSFIAGVHGEYQVQLDVSDGTDTNTTIVAIDPNNALPVAVPAANPTTIASGVTVTLDGVASFDPDGDSLTCYAWSLKVPDGSRAFLQPSKGGDGKGGKKGPTCKLTKGGGIDPNAVGSNPVTFVPDVEGPYTATLWVIDDLGGVSDPVSLTLSPHVNTPPVVDAGADQMAVVGDTVALNGTATDADGDPLGFRWALTSLPDGSALTVITGFETESASFVPDVPGLYVITFAADDGSGFVLDNLNVEVVSKRTGITNSVQETVNQVGNLPPSELKNSNVANAMTTKLMVILDAVGTARFDKATRQIDSLLKHLDGCAANGKPDKNDWVTDCADQQALQQTLLDLKADIAVEANGVAADVTAAVQGAKTSVGLMPAAAFKKAKQQGNLLDNLDAVLEKLAAGKYVQAGNKLQNGVLDHMDGCATSGVPDADDWFKSCLDEGSLYPSLLDAKVRIAP